MISHIDYLTTSDRCRLRYGIYPCRQELVQGTVLLLSGRSEFMEKYTETIQDLNRRGFHVYSFDWRGQGLSTRGLKDRHKGYVGSYLEYLADLEQFVSEILLPNSPEPLLCLSHSMGGHIFLRYLHDHPGVFHKAVLVSPMVDIFTPPVPRPLTVWLTHLARRLRQTHAYAPGEGCYRPPDPERFKTNSLSTDLKRYLAAATIVDGNPDLALGGVTYGWLAATFDSIEVLNRPDYLAAIHTPSLMVTAGADRVVPPKAQRKVCRAMPDCRFEWIPGAYHEILMEADRFRDRFWQAFEGFVGLLH
ncbi:MAG: alpha/beta fold hydrolase [Desulfococcaceae bacterium]